MKYLLILLLFLGTKVVLAQQITILAQNKPIGKIIKELESNYNLKFAYSSDVVNLNKKVTFHIQNQSIENVLQVLFKGTAVTFQISGNSIVLYKKQITNYTISGYLREFGTRELLIGVVIHIEPLNIKTVSNAYGFYSITLPSDTHQISFSYLGYNSQSKFFYLNQNTQLDLFLKSNIELGEIIIKSTVSNNNKTLNLVDIPLKEISNVPMILGEKDVVKYLMQMPGVQKGSEGNSYMYVRGGGPDQNLVLIDDAVIYNAYHFLGLSSLVSGNELRNAELIKGGFSSKYGGRLSSVLNMSLKDGNKEKFGGEASLGFIASKLLLEGPLIKNKASFVFSARRSFFDQFFGLTSNSDGVSLFNYYFYDLHGKVSFNIGKKSKLFISSYLGNDNFKISQQKDDGINWGNNTFSVRWNQQFSNKLFSNTSFNISNYKTQIGFGFIGNQSDSNTSTLNSTIKDYSFKTDFDYLFLANHQLKFGAGVTFHETKPFVSINNFITNQTKVIGEGSSASDAFLYAEVENNLFNKLKIISGLRFSYFKNNVGYFRAEPRVSIIYSLKYNWTANSSYSLMNQYVNLISSLNNLGFPSDIWTLSNDNLKPQRANLITAGIFKNKMLGGQFSIGIEGYYKTMENITSLKEGATFLQMVPLFSPEIQVNNANDLLTQGNSKSIGCELMIRKTGTRFLGQISYTLSRTTMQFNEINRGNEFLANYDRTHDFGINLVYKTKKRFSISANWIYGTGYPVSIPVGQFRASNHTPQSGNVPGLVIYDYENKNNYRMRAYHRLDLSFQYTYLIKNKFLSTFELSLYNTYNRANPFFYQITTSDTNGGSNPNTVVKQFSLFPIIPSISWSVKF
ncbi:MAG: TonB-dependent receptor domain-containing protein [Candidatus Methylacidiphilales bacterium]